MEQKADAEARERRRKAAVECPPEEAETRRENGLCMTPIARIHTDFPTKFGIPRQSGLVHELEATIIFEKEYRRPEAVRGLDAFSHLWLIWYFSETAREGWSATVRPPRLGGNRRVGVFATRSPFRPNALGLSAVTLQGVEFTADRGPVLHVRGADLMDGTPILDVKPYLPFADAYPDARGGFADGARGYALEVCFPPELLCLVPPEKRGALVRLLEGDPRPSYQHDENRLYGFGFAGLEIKFTVSGGTLYVRRVEKDV